MTTPSIYPDDLILAELSPVPGVRAVAAVDPASVAEKSAAAFDHALGTINSMCRRLQEEMNKAENRPTEIQLKFGLKLTTAGTAVVASAAVEGAIEVNIKWEPQKERPAKDAAPVA